ncbi:MAG: histidinol dehydrogenase [Micrococcales bacterium]|nr:histidinol dehydrogenase [Micrococcales bacterium]
MMRRIDLRGVGLTPEVLAQALPRAEVDVEAVLDQVRPLMAEVAQRGQAALIEQAERFDGVVPPTIEISAERCQAALDRLDRGVRRGLEVAIERTRVVHRAQIPPDLEVELADGAKVAQRWIPVERVGLYVPGGLAVYPSSVVMNVVPAQEAGVGHLAVASPAQADHGGLPHPTILAACAMLGVDQVLAAGGAGAIAMFAYGIAGLVQPVDVVTGPGNIWVAAAKRLALGVVGIDAEAGPTEIAIVADGSANPDHIAADLVGQAEHDPLAASVLITTSPRLADEVDQLTEARSQATKHAARVNQALTGPQSGLVIVSDMDAAVEAANRYAAEHLEIQTANASQLAERIHSAGAIFVGAHTPVPLGDYLAGSNHVLPTGGTARFASGLGVTSFLKSVQQVTYSQAALQQVAAHIEALAKAEDLPAHGEAVGARLKDNS